MEKFLKEESIYIAHTYSRQPIVLVEGKGSKVKDINGKEYLDFFSGIAVSNIGHCHPEVVKAIQKQAEILMHTSNLYYTKPQIELAKLLYQVSGGYQSFFCNSGAEAVEAAIKLARKHTNNPEIIAAKNSFHGRTLAALSATGQDKYKQGFDPLPSGFKHVPYGDFKALKKKISKQTAAVMLEPIQGEGGVVIPPARYLEDVARECRDKGVLLIFDEVQTGFGRTGSMFAWQGINVEPDIFTLAKAMGGGVPIGAMLAKEKIMKSFQPGDHASTFGGNPVTCAASKAAIQTIIEENLSERAQLLGTKLLRGLQKLQKKHRIIKEVRGRGLLIGVEMSINCKEVVARARDMHLLVNCTHENVIRLAPPLIIEEEHIDQALLKLDRALAGERK